MSSAALWYSHVKLIVEDFLKPQLIGKYLDDTIENEDNKIKDIHWSLIGNIPNIGLKGSDPSYWREITLKDDFVEATQQRLGIRDHRGRVLLSLQYEYNMGCCGIMEMMLLYGHQKSLYAEFLSHMCKLMQGKITSKNILYWAVPTIQPSIVEALRKNDFHDHGPAVRNPNTGKLLQAYMKVFPMESRFRF